MALTESEIRVIVAAEVRKAGFDKANRQATILEKKFKSLGKTIVSVFAAREIIRFGKASVKAFAEEDKAIKLLSNSLSNLGLAYQGANIETFIANAQRSAAVSDDELRPAFQALANATLDVAKSQELLNLALDISAATGKDLSSVVAGLSRAYLKDVSALAKLNVGLTGAQLKTLSFAEAQALLTQKFSGQAAVAATTYEGKVRALSIAFDEARETVGKGLIRNFEILADGKFDKVLDGIAFAADKLANGLTRAGYGVAKLKAFFSGDFKQIAKLQEQMNLELMGGFSTTARPIAGVVGKQLSQQNRLLKAAEAARKKAEAEAKKKQALELSRKRAQTIFDMENIQIVAALQGKIDGEQRTRLVTLLALNTENYKAAEKLADVVIRLNEPALRNLGVIIEAGDSVDELVKKLITSQARLAALQLTAEDFPELDNPFEEWENSLEKILEMLMAILGMQSGAIDYSKTSIMSPANQLAAARYEALYQSIIGGNNPYERAPAPIDYSQTSIASQANQLAAARYGAMQQSINVYVQGNVTTERDLVKSITDSLYETQRNGQGIVISSTGL